MGLPITPPIDPMLATLRREIPGGDGWVYEPKWDGFRCIVFRDGDDLSLWSRNRRPLTRYFPELLEPLRDALPAQCVVDGEIVVPDRDDHGLDFDALLQRIHPADSRVRTLATSTPAAFVGFDLLALADRDLLDAALGERRRMLVQQVHPGDAVHLTPATVSQELAVQWFSVFEGAGLDGVIAKRLEGTYEPGKRSLVKVKHERTACCALAGYRIHRDGAGVGSLLLGLRDDTGRLQHVGVAASFTARRRAELLDELAGLTEGALGTHPWREWTEAHGDRADRMPGGGSRWSAGKDLSWVPLRIERVVEVTFGQLENGRFRHGVRFQQWRLDLTPDECDYGQLDVAHPVRFADMFIEPPDDLSG